MPGSGMVTRLAKQNLVRREGDHLRSQKGRVGIERDQYQYRRAGGNRPAPNTAPRTYCEQRKNSVHLSGRPLPARGYRLALRRIVSHMEREMTAALRIVEGSSMDKSKALDAALSQIERAFGKGSIMKLGKNERDMEIETVSTGSLGLDIALG